MFTTRLRLLIAFSSIAPTELYTKQELNKIANEKILVS